MSNFWKRLKQVGPGAVVAAAFIGPGTVTTCTVSGASYGYTLLWALLFSTISVIVLQSMASKLGIVKKVGLGEALREKYTGKGVRILLAILVIGAVFIGNVAYETGNISGGILGLQAIWPSLGKIPVAIFVFAVAAGLLLSGKYDIVEKVLTALVVLMGILFLITAIAVKPNFGEVLKGLFVPRVPQMNRAWFYVTGLIGTTVVPYNIYLHASSSAKKWGKDGDKDEALKTSLTDSILSIGLGGIISMCIVITAAVCYDGSGTAAIASGKAMAEQLKPILGSWATVAFGIGLFAAGMSSAITAPLAAAFASSGILGWGEDMKKKRFMAIWGIVLIFGLVAVCTLGASPTEIILFAQAANAFLLPITAILLMIVCNDKKYMDGHGNGLVINILGVIVLAVTLLIAFRNMTAFTESFMKLING
ncbi:MAG: Nramp family divalent metal transporter [Bacteroidales bacterium]|nr:Nramp family divalent metal transporter [Bacteroidales bacterium]